MKKAINIGLVVLMLFAVSAQAQKSVKIGNQIWMSENLNDASKGGKCYENKPENCKKYGRLYTWEEAMKACPKGWHLPSDEEWQTLVDFAGGGEVAEKKLKAKKGWNWNYYEGESGNGTDDFGFSALPGGYGSSDGSFKYVGVNGSWWSSSEEHSSYAYYRDIYYNSSDLSRGNGNKISRHSVRCLQD